jgi:hypothetical protein
VGRSSKLLQRTKSVGFHIVPGFTVKAFSEMVAALFDFILNISFLSRHFLLHEKAKTIPAFKNGKKASVSNYRPVNFLCVFNVENIIRGCKWNEAVTKNVTVCDY